MPKKRIFQVAKELNISHIEIIDFLKSTGVTVSSLMAPLEDDIYESILSEFNSLKSIEILSNLSFNAS